MTNIEFVDDEVLFLSSSICIKYRNIFQPKGIVYSFTYFRWGQWKEYGFSEIYWLRKGYSVVSIQSSIDDWFNRLPQSVIRDIAQKINKDFSVIVAYGASMGGFAAFAFFDAIQPTHIIAISPQYSVTENFDRRWLNEMLEPHLHSVPKISRSNVRSLIIYDSFTPDRLHADEIANQVDGLVRLSLPNVGHFPGIVLNELGLLNVAQDRFIEGNSLQSVADEFKRRRRESPSFILEVSRRLASRRWQLAVHARILLDEILQNGIEANKLRLLIRERFLDPISASVRHNLQDDFNQNSPKLTEIAIKLKNSIELPISVQAVGFKVSLTMAEMIFLYQHREAGSPSYIFLDFMATEAASNILKIKILKTDFRFYKVYFFKSECFPDGTVGYIDVKHCHAYNFNKNCTVNLHRMDGFIELSICFDGESKGVGRILLIPLTQVAGISTSFAEKAHLVIARTL